MLKQPLRFRRTTVVSAGLLAFLAGLGFARTEISLPSGLIALAVCMGVVTIPRRHIGAVVGIIFLGFVVGWWRGQTVMSQLMPIRALNGQHIVATVQAENDAVYDDRQELSFDASHLRVEDPIAIDLPGNLLVAGFGEPAVYKGDVVRIEGKVYASRGSRQLRMSFADIDVLGRINSPIDTMRRKYAAGMQSALPEPLASFGLGLLIGQRSTLSQTVTRELSIVGLTHIIAVSGYNLTIIMRGVKRLLKKRSKYQITTISLLLIGLFLLTSGFSASIVRAAIVSVLGLLAWYHGRTFRPIMLIAIAAALTAGWNPLYIWSDIGWYLSFLAFFGVLIVAPLANKRLFGVREPKALTGIMTESLCALIMTIPLILYIFHQVSLIALFANLLLVPLVPLAMLCALAAGLGGMLLPLLSGIIAFPARIILTYMLDLVQVLSRIPHALIERQLSLAATLFIYGCVVVFVSVLWRVTEKKHAIITEENT